MDSDDDELYDFAYDDEEDDVDSEADDGGGGDMDMLEEEDTKTLETEEPPLCSAITKERLSAAQRKDLLKVMELFNIKQHHARALLIHHRWNVYRIQDQLERKGQEPMLRAAGIVLHESCSAVAAPASASVITCMVCFEDYSPSLVSTMDCGHSFCNDCWTGHFVSALLDGGKKQMGCMAVRCPGICDEAVVQRLLLAGEHPGAAARFDELLLRSYVDDNDGLVKWCPSAPHCGRAIRVPDGADPRCEVECPCGVAFCFGCSAPAHSPCPCAMWARWEAKSRGESENVKWILANTKSCPKCLKPIVKEGGCNLVTCKCGQHLCWLCGAATGFEHNMDRILGHSCNRFTPEEKKKVDDAKRQLHRYTHYYGRFQEHGLSSYRAEQEKLGPAIAEQVEALQRDPFGPGLRDCSWLPRAHRVLLRSRQVLSRSYVFAYCMFDDGVRTLPPPPESGGATLASRQGLFEHYQGLLEQQVERLSEVLASDFRSLGEEATLQVRLEVRNLVEVVRRHCGEVYKCIDDELLPMLAEPMTVGAYQPHGPFKAKEEEEFAA
ncbi:hypothetical protein ACP4OV_007612 [Aristida adscensionis]